MTPAGEGGGLTQPKKAGWPLPIACGRTSRNAVATRSSSAAGCPGRGRPSSCSRRPSGSGCQTGLQGSAARWSATPSTSACAALRNAGSPDSRASASLTCQAYEAEEPRSSRERGLDLGLEPLLRHRALDALGDLAVAEEQERRDRHDLVLRRRLDVLVGVELDDLELGPLTGDLLDDRADHPAWTAPGRPEVDQDGLV